MEITLSTICDLFKLLGLVVDQNYYWSSTVITEVEKYVNENNYIVNAAALKHSIENLERWFSWADAYQGTGLYLRLLQTFLGEQPGSLLNYFLTWVYISFQLSLSRFNVKSCNRST